jgi:hypothetical protein
MVMFQAQRGPCDIANICNHSRSCGVIARVRVPGGSPVPPRSAATVLTHAAGLRGTVMRARVNLRAVRISARKHSHAERTVGTSSVIPPARDGADAGSSELDCVCLRTLDVNMCAHRADRCARYRTRPRPRARARRTHRGFLRRRVIISGTARSRPKFGRRRAVCGTLALDCVCSGARARMWVHAARIVVHRTAHAPSRPQAL